MKLLNENLEEMYNESRAKRIAAYRKWANLTEDAEITADNINEWALNRTSCFMNYDINKLREELTESIKPLNEADTLGDMAEKAAEEIDAEVKQVNGQIESALDWALKQNIREKKYGGHEFQNVLFIGEAGTGKTARTRAWAKRNGINLVNILASTMDDTDLGGAISPNKDGNAVVRLASTEFDKLNEPNSVLFLDEYNRAPKSVRGTLLTLINDHVIPDGRTETGVRELPNFLFTIAAINPPSTSYDTDKLDDAERNRFAHYEIVADNDNTLNYLLGELDRRIDLAKAENDTDYVQECEGRKGIAKALLSSKEFEMNSAEDNEKSESEGNGLSLSARSLTRLLLNCDGTKANFLSFWNRYCDNLKKDMAEAILKNYTDINDKANDALKNHDSESSVFKSKKGLSDQLLDIL